MAAVKLILIGGFLGAGKTTTLSRLAEHYQMAGKRVAVITNDQAEGLVDTVSFLQRKLPVLEIAGACFCCRFHELRTAAENLIRDIQPDIILAEPVGSCTDLVATVLRPLISESPLSIELAPFVCLFKIEQGLSILKSNHSSGFSTEAEYVFLKQLEEADIIAINRIDEYSLEERSEARQLLRKRFPHTPVLEISARTGENCNQLFKVLNDAREWEGETLSIDYEIYAQGEADLGWLNAKVMVNGLDGVPAKEFLMDLLASFQKSAEEAGDEIAHLKVALAGEEVIAVANLVRTAGNIEFSRLNDINPHSAELTVNARVAMDPEKLQLAFESALKDAAQGNGMTFTTTSIRSFRPGKPEPTFRFASSVETRITL